MSGAPVRSPIRDRVQRLSVLLKDMRIDGEMIRIGHQITRDEAMVRQNRSLDELLKLSAAMHQQSDWAEIDALLSRQEDGL